MYSVSLLNHLQFMYHVTCSTITVKPGTDAIHSVRTTITQVHFVCVLSWVTTVHFVCITCAYVFHINSLFLNHQESTIPQLLTDILHLSLYFLFTPLAASVSITNSQKVYMPVF